MTSIKDVKQKIKLQKPTFFTCFYCRNNQLTSIYSALYATVGSQPIIYPNIGHLTLNSEMST